MPSLSRTCLAVAVLVAATPGSALAASCFEDLVAARPGMIESDGPARAAKITSREALAMIEAGGSLTFTREVRDFWRFKVRRGVDPEDLRVRYSVSGGGSRNGKAVNLKQDSQRFPVRVIADRPVVLCENDRYRIVSGGFTAIGRASKIGLAGVYALDIDVDVIER